jgi:hypothetical protein
MSNSRLVRASRDGDLFHYLWAARRCLRLLAQPAKLVAISIEGASPAEGSSSGPQSQAGEEIIDIAEYYGDQNFSDASAVWYMQLKHSTLRIDEPRQPSELELTLAKFSAKDTLTGSDLKAVNTFAAPDKVKPAPLEPPRPGERIVLQLPARSYSRLLLQATPS